MREPKNQMLGTMEPPLMQLSVKLDIRSIFWASNKFVKNDKNMSVKAYRHTMKK